MINVEDHINLVHHVVKRYQFRHDCEDIFQVGCIGLIKAAKRFDPDRGFEFSTYAVPIIQGSIWLHLRADRPIHVGRGTWELSEKIKRQGLDDELPEAIAEQLGCTVNQAKRAKHFARVVLVSGDREISEDMTIYELIASYQDYSSDVVHDFLQTLTKRDREIVLCRMDGMTQEEIAVKVGLTQPLVSRCIRKIGEKWRQYVDGGDVTVTRRTARSVS